MEEFFNVIVSIEKEMQEIQKFEQSNDNNDPVMFSKGSPFLTILCC